MCGLAGIARRGPGGVSAERLVRMADAIRHRGPDGAGLHAAERDGDLYFASEVKALLASGEVERALDPEGLDEVFTFWASLPPRTPFRGIRALEPGCCARWQDGRLTIRRYYALAYPEAASES